MEIEGTENSMGIPVDSMKPCNVITDDDELPNSMRGVIKIKNKPIPVFCVSDFSIQNEQGEMVSLSELGYTRNAFDETVILKGTLSRFVKKIHPEVSPLMRVEELNRSTRSTRSSSQAQKGDNEKDDPEEPFGEGSTTSTGITVLSFGKINPSKNFHSGFQFFPVGYKSRRFYTSLYSSDEKIPYISEVLQIDNETPLFRVYPENNPSEAFEAGSSTGAWKKVLLAIAANQRERGEREISTGISGPEMFGFTHPQIKHYIEHMEGAEQGVNYRSSYIPQEDGVDDDDYDIDTDSTKSFHFLSDSEQVDSSDQEQKGTSKEDESDIERSEDVFDDVNPDAENEVDDVKDTDMEYSKVADVKEDESAEDDGATEDVMSIERAENEGDTDNAANVENSQSAQGLIKTELKPIRREMIGKDTFLKVRCRKIDNGYEAEDSLIDNLFYIEGLVATPVVKPKKTPVKKPVGRRIVIKQEDYKETVTETNKVVEKLDEAKRAERIAAQKAAAKKRAAKKVAAAKKAAKEAAIEESWIDKRAAIKERRAAMHKKEMNKVTANKKEGRKRGKKDDDSVEEMNIPEETLKEMFDSLVMSGSYHMGFKTVGEADGMRVSVRPSYSPFFGVFPQNMVIEKIMDVIDYDLANKETSHLLRMLYSLRLLDIKPTKLIDSGLDKFIFKLTRCGIPEVENEALIVERLLTRPELRKKRFNEQDIKKKIEETNRKRDASEVLPEDKEAESKRRKSQDSDSTYKVVIPTDVTFSRPTHPSDETVSISLNITSWGIHFHERDACLYVRSPKCLFILQANSIDVSPSESYFTHFMREKRLFEMCQQIYLVYKRLQQQGQDFQYDEVVSLLWNYNTSDDVLLVEEDLIMEYPFLFREMKDLDKESDFVNAPFYFGMNDFMDTLKFRHELWKKNNQNYNYGYALQNDLSLAEVRSDLLNFDQYVVGAVSEGKLPMASSPEYPTVHPFKSDEISDDDIKMVFEIWNFLESYSSVLGIPDNHPVLFNRMTFMNHLPSDNDVVPFITNAYLIFIKYLTSEQVKKNPSLRKQMKDVNWVLTGIFSPKKNSALCDLSNYDSFIRGYLDPKAFGVEMTDDIVTRLHYIIIALMRHPDCVGFLRPVDEVSHDVPGYRDIVKNPMDFQTICKRLTEGYYFEEQQEDDDSTRGQGARGVVEDILLIYTNCRLYNGSDSSIYRYSLKMMSLTVELFRQWIEPLDDSVSDVYPIRTAIRDDSDDEINTRRSKSNKSSPGPKKQYKFKHSVVDPIVKELQSKDISNLSPHSQLQLLFTLYRLVLSSPDIQMERGKRESALDSLQREYSSILNQLRELKAVYSKQEHDLRSTFVSFLREKRKTTRFPKSMLGPYYSSPAKSQFPQEQELASFIAKRDRVVADMVGQLHRTSEELFAAEKRCWGTVPLGVDRNQNEYYFIPDDIPARIWIHNLKSGEWSYIWQQSELKQLLQWIDNRGKDEQLLYSSLCLILPQIQTLFDRNMRIPQINCEFGSLSDKKKRELSLSDLVIVNQNDKLELRQLTGIHFGIKVLESITKEKEVCRKSDDIPLIIQKVFNSMFVQNPNPRISEMKVEVKTYQQHSFKLDEYRNSVLCLEDCLFSSVDDSLVFPDWRLTRLYWRKRVEAAMSYSEINYYISDLECSCVDFSIVEALTATVDRETFLRLYEEKVKTIPRIPRINETVVYYSKGHNDAKVSFVRSNVLSGVYQYKEDSQSQDYLCKVIDIDYFWGNGNPFYRITLKTLSSSLVNLLVQSYYSSQNYPSIRLPTLLPSDDSPSIQFTCTVWMETTDSDFVIPFDTYCLAFSNNFHVGDHFKMWFRGVESQVSNTKKKGKDSRLEGSYLHGTVVEIEKTEGAFFPWECITAEWDTNGVEAGTNKINPWECEFEEKTVRTRENRGGANNRGAENRRLPPKELKEIQMKAAQVAKSHKKEDGDAFFRFLSKYWADRGMEIQQPILSYDLLDMGLFWDLMQVYGGYDNVVNTKGSWLDIYLLLPNYRASNTSAPSTLHKFYLKYMYQIEKEQREEKGLPPIGEPRLPLATCPGKGQGGKSRVVYDDEEKKEDELVDVPPGVQFLSKMLKEQETKRNTISNKCRILQFSLQYKTGNIQSFNGTIEKDYAFKGIVNGQLCMLKRQTEVVTKIINQLRVQLHQYL